MSDLCYFCNKPLGGSYIYHWSNACHAHCKPIGVSVSERQRLDELAALLNRPYGDLTGGERKQVADEITALRARLAEVEKELVEMTAAKEIHQTRRAEYFARAERAEAALKEAEKERDRLAESAEFWERCAVLNEKRFERAEAALATARRDALEQAAGLAWSDDEDRPWEHWGEHRNIVTAQTVAKEIAAAIRALANEAETSARGMP